MGHQFQTFHKGLFLRFLALKEAYQHFSESKQLTAMTLEEVKGAFQLSISGRKSLAH